MATTDMQRLIVSLEARTKAFENALNKANGVANRRARAIEGRFAAMNKRIGATMAGIGRRWVAGLAAGLSAGAFVKFSDAATRIDNSLKVAGLSGEALEAVYERLRASAIKNAAPIEALTELYGRAALVQKELGITGEELLGFTDKIAVALRVSGKSAQESSGALLQLSQALGSGVVRAEEFNSILEGALPIAQAAAAGLREAGGSVAKLRQLVVDGKVSSEAFFRAFEAGAPILEDKIKNAELTVSQSFGNLQTAVIDAAREFNKATGASNRLAEGIDNLARGVSDLRIVQFFERVSSAIERFETAVDNLANNPAFHWLAEILTGNELTQGAPIAIDTIDAQTQLVALEHEIEVLRQRIEANKEMAIDTTEAEQRLAILLVQAQALQASIAGAGIAGFRQGGSGPLTRNGPRPKAVPEPVSLSDFAPPSGKGKGGKSKRSEWEREVAQIKERTAALQAETAAMAGLNPLIDDYGYAVEFASAKQELLNAAKEAGLAITPDLAAKIDQLASSYAQASVDAEKLAESQDRIRQRAQDSGDFGKDVLGGFIQDLKSGKSAAEALEGALAKVADQLLDIALTSLFHGPTGKGGTGPLGSFFSFLFPFANGGIAAHGRPVPLKRFAKGGVSRTAAVFGEAGPEAAVPLPDGRSIPVDLRVPKVQASPQQSITRIDMPISIHAPGADAAQLARVREEVVQLRKAVPAMIDRRTDQRRVRNTRP